MNRLRIQVVAAVTAAVGLALSVVYRGSSAASTALRAYAYATSIAIFLFLIYDRYVWHWPIVRRVTKKPDLRGTWKGELKSSHLPDGKPFPPIPSILRIRQTNAAGTVVKATGAVIAVATNLLAMNVLGQDATPGVITYVLTLTVGSGSAASAVSAVHLAATVI